MDKRRKAVAKPQAESDESDFEADDVAPEDRIMDAELDAYERTLVDDEDEEDSDDESDADMAADNTNETLDALSGEESDDGEDAEDEDEDEDEEEDAAPREPGVLLPKTSRAMANVMAKLLASRTGPAPEGSDAEEEFVAPVLAKDTASLRKITAQRAEERRAREVAHAKRAKVMLEQKDIVDYNPQEERRLLRIATKGAVALFNAVKTSQVAAPEGDKKVDKIGVKLTKSNFMDALKTTATSGADAAPADDKATASAAAWMQEDFLMGSSMKKWTGKEVPDAEDSDGDLESGSASQSEAEAEVEALAEMEAEYD